MQTIAQQKMTLNQAEARIKTATARKDVEALARVAHRLRGLCWSGTTEDQARARKLWRIALNTKKRVQAAPKKTRRTRKKEVDSSTDG